MSDSAVFSAVKPVLETIASLPDPAKEDRTFLDITGYGHREYVASNILAHFLDANAEHGLGAAVAEALLEAVYGGDRPIGEVESVEREVRTREGKYLDIVVTTDQHVIGIENKINAPHQNPWNAYMAHLEEHAGREKQAVLILLCRSVASSCGTGEAAPEPFRLVTYSSFFDKLLPRLGRAAPDADQRQIFILLDFVRTIQNMNRGSRMDETVLKSLGDHEEIVEKFLDQFAALKADMRKKVEQVRESLEDGATEGRQRAEASSPEVSFALRRRQLKLYDKVVVTIKGTPDRDCDIEARLSPKGWQILVAEPHDRTIPWLEDQYEVIQWGCDNTRFKIQSHSYGYAEDDRLIQELNRLLQHIIEPG